MNQLVAIKLMVQNSKTDELANDFVASARDAFIYDPMTKMTKCEAAGHLHFRYRSLGSLLGIVSGSRLSVGHPFPCISDEDFVLYMCT